MSALGVFAALVMGLPLTLVLTPLFYAGTLLIAEVINHYSPLPQEFWQNVNDLGQLTVRVGDYFFNHRGTLYPDDVMWGAGFLLLPGMLVAFLLWVSVTMLFRRGGVGGALASLGAREPNAQDLKELQLADVAQEMAIAAGLPAPKVMLLDSRGANAAAIGTSAKDARIVLSRRLLDDLDRDQLQALLGHLVGSIGNGDLRIAFTVTSVFEACGLLVTMINSPFGRQSRSALWRMLRYTFSRGGDAARAGEADTVAGLLTGTLDINHTDIDQFFNSTKPGAIRKFLRFIFFPIVFTNIAVEITLWFFLNLLLGPAMALVWRTRRYLADASAVELTRNPEALASALDRLARDNTAVEGGAWATHLFVINPQGDRSARASGPNLEEMRQAAQLWAASGGGAATANPSQLSMAEFAKLRSQMVATGFAAARGDQAAAARMEAFMVAVQKAQGQEVTFHAKDLADVAGAMKGDPAAMARLRTLSEHRQAQRPAKQGSAGLQTQSFLSFHPPLKRRLRRLERMGAQYRAGAHAHMGTGGRIFAGILFLIIGPLMAVAFAGIVVVIAMMIMLNLVVLSIWMVAIHAIFVWWNGG